MAPLPTPAQFSVRALPPAEWGTLAHTELGSVWTQLAPGAARVLVIEQAGTIVACWASLPVHHVEGFWIEPSHRGLGALPRRLLTAMRRMLRDDGITGVVTSAATPEIADYLTRLGATPLPPSYVWKVS